MIEAVIFDKDGTLFDFRSSWSGWVERLLAELAAGPEQTGVLADVLGYDPGSHQFLPGSPVVAMTTPEIADLVHPHVAMPIERLNWIMNRLAMAAPMQPAVNLGAVLGGLRAMGLTLGLATNDTEEPARQHLGDAGVLDLFAFVAGCDSGWGGKPEPGQLLEFARRAGLAPDQVAMVGDSKHDLDAARAAGMRAVAVLTGVARRDQLTPHADVVMADISGLADWIAVQNAV